MFWRQTTDGTARSREKYSNRNHKSKVAKRSRCIGPTFPPKNRQGTRGWDVQSPAHRAAANHDCDPEEQKLAQAQVIIPGRYLDPRAKKPLALCQAGSA